MSEFKLQDNTFSGTTTIGDGNRVEAGREPEDSGLASKAKPKHRVLFLAANAMSMTPLNLAEEERGIQESGVELQTRWAVRVEDLLRALLEIHPTVLHFSGHGSREGRIILLDDAGGGREVPPQALADAVARFDSVECVVLNACFSDRQAKRLAAKVPHVVGTAGTIQDGDAIRFSRGFYRALAYGRSYEDAFALGRTEIAFAEGQDAKFKMLGPASV